MTEDVSLAPGWPFENAGRALPGTCTHAEATAEIAALVHEHAALLFRVAYSVLRDRAEAEDCVQDTFLRALEHQAKIAALHSPRAWLIRIAWNLALDRRRRTQPQQADELFLDRLRDPKRSPETQLSQHQQLALTLAAIDALPKLEREALLLSAIDDLTPADIAAVLGKTSSAARALLHRARTRLKDRLAQKGVRR
jgi:RNA polymerase sigma-70 factor (ECF subfamily)